MKPGEGDLIYLYCVTEKAPKLKWVEELVNNLHFVYHRDLYAVVSIVSDNEFGEENLKRNLSDMGWIKFKVDIHERIIEGIMEGACVIPFKFATLFNSEDNLKMNLEEHAKEFKENLRRLGDKEEWGVKVYCDMGRLGNSIVREDGEIFKIDREIDSASSQGKAFFLKKKKEELMNMVVNKKLNEYGQDIFNRLREEGIEVRINKLLPKEVTERKDEMILNSAFLVDKGRVSAFISIVDILKAQYNTLGLFLDCTGPWPPYNFCNLSEEKVRSG